MCTAYCMAISIHFVCASTGFIVIDSDIYDCTTSIKI